MNELKWQNWKYQTSEDYREIQKLVAQTNVEFIDQDHYYMIALILKLEKYLSRLEVRFDITIIEEIIELVRRIRDSAATHFREEEDFIAIHGLENIEEHAKDHQLVLKEMDNYLESIIRGTRKISRELKVFFLSIFVNHVNRYDYKAFEAGKWEGIFGRAHTWNEVRSVVRLTHIQQLDADHKLILNRLIETMNMLIQEEDSLTEKIVLEARDNVTAPIQAHFDHEETIMKRYNIPYSRKHIEIHHSFFVKENQLLEDYMGHQISLQEIKEWLIDWWIRHINHVDSRSFEAMNWLTPLIAEAKTYEEVIKGTVVLGVPDFQADHEHILDLLMFLRRNIHKSNGKQYALLLLYELLEKTREHTKKEEEMIVKFQMQGEYLHRYEHAELLIRLENYIEDYEMDRVVPDDHFVRSLLWEYIEHFNRTDYRVFYVQ